MIVFLPDHGQIYLSGRKASPDKQLISDEEGVQFQKYKRLGKGQIWAKLIRYASDVSLQVCIGIKAQGKPLSITVSCSSFS